MDGGHFKPNQCIARHRVAIIGPSMLLLNNFNNQIYPSDLQVHTFHHNSNQTKYKSKNTRIEKYTV